MFSQLVYNTHKIAPFFICLFNLYFENGITTMLFLPPKTASKIILCSDRINIEAYDENDDENSFELGMT